MKPNIAKRAARILGMTVLGLLLLGGGAVLYCIPMPGESRREPPPLTGDERRTADELRRHVAKLALIGEPPMSSDAM